MNQINRETKFRDESYKIRNRESGEASRFVSARSQVMMKIYKLLMVPKCLAHPPCSSTSHIINKANMTQPNRNSTYKLNEEFINCRRGNLRGRTKRGRVRYPLVEPRISVYS